MDNIKLKIFKEFREAEEKESQPLASPGQKRAILFISDLAFAPPTDVWETEKEVVVMMEIANVSPDEIRLQYDDGYLIVEGQRPEPTLLSRARIIKFHKKEIDYGEFRVRIKMNSRINQDKIKATYQDGMLTIILPKDSHNKIAVRVEIPVSQKRADGKR